MKAYVADYIGRMGRFGNSLFQYCHAKALAEKNNAVLVVPSDWNGRRVFDIDDPSDLKQIQADQLTVVKLDKGYYTNSEALSLYTRAWAKNHLRIQRHWLTTFPKVANNGIAVHLRRGDFAKDPGNRPWVSLHSALVAVVKHCGWDALVRAEWVIEGDKPNGMYGPELEGIEFLPDWLTLYYADTLFRGASSFSFWAAVLGEASHVYAPIINKGGYGHYDYGEGNHHRTSLLDNQWIIREE